MMLFATLSPCGAQQDVGAGCVSRPGGSRWALAPDQYKLTATFGRSQKDGNWLASIAGLAVSDSNVFVFDQGRPAILELSKGLDLVREIGRAGRGPGEFFTMSLPFLPRYWDFRYLDASEDVVLVYDQVDIEVFERDGTFKTQIRAQGTPPLGPYGIRYVVATDGGVLYVQDSVDARGGHPRRFQVWAVDGLRQSAKRRLLWQVELPEPRELGHSAPRDPQPLWGGIAGCQVATDGSGPYLFRYDRHLNHLDSVPLPAWDVPALGHHPDDHGIVLPGVPRRPAASGKGPPIRWTDLVVDPDGYAWLEAWTPFRDPELVIFVISIQTGNAIRIDSRMFPRAFGEPGVIYTVERLADTGEQYVARYGRR